MRFWDTSAVVPLLVNEPSSPDLGALLAEDGVLIVWWATRVECVSALVRRTREGDIDAGGEERARLALKSLAEAWSEMLPTSKLRASAERLLTVHPLRAADALQLAAALRWCEGEPGGRAFVSMDGRLREAARREGFSLAPNPSE